MSKKVKIILCIVVALICFVILIQKDGAYEVIEVVDGNTVKLDNGVVVKLIGVSSTNESKTYLEEYVHTPVDILSDAFAPFNKEALSSGMTVYAYLHGGDNATFHINAAMLQAGVSDLIEGSYNRDTLAAFRKYASLGARNRKIDPTPTPVKPIPYQDDDIILPNPPRDKRLSRKHSAWYTDGNMNLEMIDEACDYNCPYTKQFANSLAGKSPGNFNAGQICEIFNYCYNHWRYVNDPKGTEYVASASESIEGNLVGDCDDFAILMASCMLAIGGDVCINTGFGPEGGHAFTEVDIAPIGESSMQQEIKSKFRQYSPSQLNVRRENGHIWLNLDWQAAYPGGRYFDCSNGRSAYPCLNGRWSWEELN